MSRTDIVQVKTKEQIAGVEALAFEIWHEHYIPIIGVKQVEYMLKKFQSQEAISEQIEEGCSYYLIKAGDEV